jgi:DNA-directed RNA polymerase specialized sigma24 family protein
MDSTIDPTVALYAAPAVFADFYRAEFTSALALAMALTVSVADAEELVQDLFVGRSSRYKRSRRRRRRYFDGNDRSVSCHHHTHRSNGAR